MQQFFHKLAEVAPKYYWCYLGDRGRDNNLNITNNLREKRIQFLMKTMSEEQAVRHILDCSPIRGYLVDSQFPLKEYSPLWVVGRMELDDNHVIDIFSATEGMDYYDYPDKSKKDFWKTQDRVLIRKYNIELRNIIKKIIGLT